MNYATKDQLITFETRIKDLWEEGDLPFLIHLCGGNEDQLINIFSQVQEGDWIFSSHRNHYHALLSGIPAERLEQLIREGRSMFVFDKARNFVTSSVLAGTCCMAAGVAWQLQQTGSKNRVWCFLGDGASEEGHAYEAALFVDANDLPCTFVVECNARQVSTDLKTRRGGKPWLENPLSNFKCVARYSYIPTWPHAGSGSSKQIKFKPESIEAYLRDAKGD